MRSLLRARRRIDDEILQEREHLRRTYMLSSYAVRYLYALESIADIIALWSWWRVWRQPGADRLALVGFCTCSGFAVKIFRIALAIVLRAH